MDMFEIILTIGLGFGLIFIIYTVKNYGHTPDLSSLFDNYKIQKIQKILGVLGLLLGSIIGFSEGGVIGLIIGFCIGSIGFVIIDSIIEIIQYIWGSLAVLLYFVVLGVVFIGIFRFFVT